MPNKIEMIVLDADLNGNPFIKGQEPKAIKELWEVGSRHYENKLLHAKLTTALKEDKETMKALYRKYPSAFVPTDNDPNVLIYSIAGLEIEVDREETIDIKTRKSETAPPISVDNQGASGDQSAPPKKRTRAKSDDEKVLEKF